MILKIWSYLAACLVLHKTIASQILEFCADKQLFSFSKETCPGGVLFKSPIELTEPCYCISNYLEAYSISCDASNNFHNTTDVCLRSNNDMGKHDHVFINLLQPNWEVTEGKHGRFRHMDCRSVHKKCTKRDVNNAIFSDTKYEDFSLQTNVRTQLPIHNIKRNRASAVQGKRGRHFHRLQKRDITNDILGEKLRTRIQETIDLLNDLQFGSVGIKKPKSMSFQLLAQTVAIFNYIAPNVIAEDELVISILTMFLKKYADMELPGYSGRLTVDDLVDRGIFENVMGALQECTSKASDATQELEFITTEECPPNITHVIHKVSTVEAGFKRVQYQLGSFMPIDRKYVPEKEDFLLGALWKIFDAVFSYCFSSVFSYRSSHTLNNYFNIINNIFTSPWTANDYLSDHDEGTLVYSSRIEHENLTILMTNLDYMTEAVHTLSRYKAFFKKPVSKNGKRKNKEPEPEIVTTRPTPSTTESPIFRNRNKRSIHQSGSLNQNWADLEIWDGRAYCLQTSNDDMPSNIANAFPSIEEFCALR